MNFLEQRGTSLNQLTVSHMNDIADRPATKPIPMMNVLTMCPDLKIFTYKHEGASFSKALGIGDTSCIAAHLTRLDLLLMASFRETDVKRILDHCPNLTHLILPGCKSRAAVDLLYQYDNGIVCLGIGSNHFCKPDSIHYYSSSDDNNDNSNDDDHKDHEGNRTNNLSDDYRIFRSVSKNHPTFLIFFQISLPIFVRSI